MTGQLAAAKPLGDPESFVGDHINNNRRLPSNRADMQSELSLNCTKVDTINIICSKM